MRRLLQGDALEKRADELGVPKDGPFTHSVATRRVSDVELQRRVIEAERSVRESKLWLIATISAIASVVSAVAAWVAVLKK